METIYKGYKIKEVFTFTNGKADFQIYEPEGEEGTIYPYATLEEAKNFVDEKIEE